MPYLIIAGVALASAIRFLAHVSKDVKDDSGYFLTMFDSVVSGGSLVTAFYYLVEYVLAK